MIAPQDIYQSKSRISLYINETPLEYSATLSNEIGSDIYLKLENLRSLEVLNLGEA